MRRAILVLLLVVVAAVAAESLLVADSEWVVGPLAQRVLLGAGLLGLAAWLLLPGAGGAQRAMAVVAGVLAAVAVVAVAALPRPLAVALDQDELVRRFSILFYGHELYKTSYLGVRCLQYPTDQWVMQEIISEVRPDFIVETGTWAGGSTLYYAHLLEKVNPQGKVLTVDIKPHGRVAPTFPAWAERVEFFLGSSIDDAVVSQIRDRVAGGRVMVTLDSSHETSHVAKELERYAPMVTVGSYLVVSDTDLGGNPNHHPSVDNPGPMPAVREFLSRHPEFVVDRSRERYLLTQNPLGFLKRIS